MNTSIPTQQLRMGDLAEGRRLRDEGAANVAQRNRAFVNSVERQALLHAAEMGSVSPNDLTITPPRDAPNAMGAAWLGFRKYLQPTGVREPNRRPEAHGRKVDRYMLNAAGWKRVHQLRRGF